MIRKALRTRIVRSMLIYGVVLAVLAAFSAHRFPVFFTAIGLAWLGLFAVNVIHEARRAD